jgi:hypothetical protein
MMSELKKYVHTEKEQKLKKAEKNYNEWMWNLPVGRS